MRRRDGEVADMAHRRRLDFCCVQECRWKGGSARLMGEYKFFWAGCDQGNAGVGVLVARRWVEHVIEVKRFNERIIVVKVAIGKRILNLYSVYAPQAGRSGQEKEEFYETLGRTVDGVGEGEGLFVCGDLNGHVGEETDGYQGVHGGYGYGSRNLEGELVLEFADARALVVANTWFKKKPGHMITFESGGNRSVVDYVMVRHKERGMIRDVKVIPNEPCLMQHKLLICVADWKERPKPVKRQFISRRRVWKLREPVNQVVLKELVEERAERRERNGVEEIWTELKGCLIEGSDKVCGKTKQATRHKETGWWDDTVKKAIDEKRRLYILWKEEKKAPANCQKGQKAGKGLIRTEKERAYHLANKESKRAVYKAKDAHRLKFVEELEKEWQKGKGNVYRTVKQTLRKNVDIVGGGCIKDRNGNVVVEEDATMAVWKEYYEKLLNEEFDWDKGALDAAEPVSGPSEKFTFEEVKRAIKQARYGKAAGPSEVTSDMLKASGDAGVSWVMDLCNEVVREGRIPGDWKHSLMVSVYKGKGDALECGSYRGIKLIDHGLKILERLIEKKVRDRIDLDDMQFGFRPGRGTTDAIFIVRQLQERHLAKNRVLWMAFVDLEKAFDRVPREVVWWALRKVGVEEWMVKVIMTMYEGATTAVRVGPSASEEFEVNVGVHQGSVLSPLLFTIVLEALSKEFRLGLPWELFYADDLVIIAVSKQELMERLESWKKGMECKGLRVNVKKTKVMSCCVEADTRKESGKYPCGVCGKGVGNNAILCLGCSKWIHCRCSGVKGRLSAEKDFRCAKCAGGIGIGVGVVEKEVELKDGSRFECVNEFCYLGDMLGARGGAAEASTTRARSAWKQFRLHTPILAKRGVSLRMKGRVYRACVQSVMTYASETWAMKTEDEQRLERNENAMLRWMCGVTLKDRVATKDLRQRLGIEGVLEKIRRGRLRWFGHVERKDDGDWVSACRGLEVEGVRGRGRPKKSWRECVNADMRSLGLAAGLAQDRIAWSSAIVGNRPTHASMESGRKTD